MAIGAGAAAYAMSMDKKTRRRWKKRMGNVNFLEEFDLDDYIPSKRQMKRYQRRLKKAIS
ncbi:hypothetical protein EBO34_02035 [Alteribacter keqinensis]|uniref:Uncharacterized protein n=2 Tax=Bacillaceae TaxID=186817 RepID=A0A3M7TT22_9BACI|nr:hypothetical protein EBO34_02035 [Alteribacter keqinensis]